MSKISESTGLFKLSLQQGGHADNLMLVRKAFVFTSEMHFGENSLHDPGKW